jgi:hypothetical protein
MARQEYQAQRVTEVYLGFKDRQASMAGMVRRGGMAIRVTPDR